MSTRGVLTAINRNGINRVRDVSILRKASFEETTDILFGAAVFSEVDMLRGVSERIIFGEPVKIGTRSFEVMIDRDSVKNYNVKGKKDREHEIEEKDEINIYGEGPAGSRTPIGPLGMETPIVKIGGSVHNPRSSYYGGGGTSPYFQTPIYLPSSREFSEHNRIDELPASSPMPKTPMLLNPSNTPLIAGGLSSMSPLYNPGNTSFHGNSIHRPSSQMRSPSYLYQGSASVNSSPNYSSLRSHSPDYNSPMGSSGRYGNSPNYSLSPMDQNRGYFKKE
jgi:DNA-directed RNA polymerase II subunit RPB1